MRPPKATDCTRRPRRLGALGVVLVIVVAAGLVWKEQPVAHAVTTVNLPGNYAAVAEGGQCSFYQQHQTSANLHGVAAFACALSGNPVRLTASFCTGSRSAGYGASDAVSPFAGTYPGACRSSSRWVHWGVRLDVPSLATVNPDIIADNNYAYYDDAVMGGPWHTGTQVWTPTCTSPTGGAPTTVTDVALSGYSTRLFSRSTVGGGMLVRGIAQNLYGAYYCANSSAACTQPTGNGHDQYVLWVGCADAPGGSNSIGGDFGQVFKNATDVYGMQNVQLWSCDDIACTAPKPVHVATAARPQCITGCLGGVGGAGQIPKIPTGTMTCNFDISQKDNATELIDFSQANKGVTFRFACFTLASQNELQLQVVSQELTAHPYTFCFSLTGATCEVSGAPPSWSARRATTIVAQRITTGGQWAYTTGEVNLTPMLMKGSGDFECTGAAPNARFVSGNWQTQVCPEHPIFIFSGGYSVVVGKGNTSQGAQSGGQGVRVEAWSHTGQIPPPPLLAPGGSKAPVPYATTECVLTRFTIRDDTAQITFTDIGGPDERATSVPPSAFWNGSHSYTWTAEFTGNPTKLMFFLDNSVEGDSVEELETQRKDVLDPTSPRSWTMTPLHDGYYFGQVTLVDSAGHLCDFALGTDHPDGAYGNTRQDALARIKKCLDDTYSEGTSSFDLLDPTTWAGAAVAALNPANFVAASFCILQATVTPTKNVRYWNDKARTEFEGTTVGKISQAALTPFTAVNAFASNASGGSCAGPTIPIRGIDTQPMDSCAHSEFRDVVNLGATVIVYLAGGLMVAAVLASALGLKLGAVLNRSGGGDDS